MDISKPAQDPAALLAHGAWLRRLALCLIGDTQQADELVQDTWTAALEGGAARRGDLRAWLGGVIRNLARKRIGKNVRERMGIESARGMLSAPDPTQVLEREELRRQVVDAVLSLEEPLRGTLLLRFYEDLSNEQIAAAQGIPASTVRSRVQRGLLRLRERLGEGEENTLGLSGLGWLLPLAGLRRPDSTLQPHTSPLPAIQGSSKLGLRVGLGLGLSAAAVLGLVRSGLFEVEPGPAPLVVGVLPDLLQRQPIGGMSSSAAIARSPVTRPKEIAEPAQRIDRRIGRVLGPDGAALGGVRLSVQSQTGKVIDWGAALVSNATGEFSLPVEDQDGTVAQLRALGPDFITLREGLLYPGQAFEPVLIVAPAVAFEGRILDQNRMGLAGSRITLEWPVDFELRFGDILDATDAAHEFWVKSSADGRFAAQSVPQISGASWRVTHPGFLPASFAHGSAAPWVLSRPTPAETRLQGVVLDALSRPVAGALVSHGLALARTDSSGHFCLLEQDLKQVQEFYGLAHPRSPARDLIAVAPGYLPARVLAADLTLGEPLTLRLGARPGELKGRVLDAQGQPASGVLLWVREAQLLGEEHGRPLTLEAVMAASVDPAWHRAQSDEQGNFCLPGLLDREYTLRAVDPGTGLRVERSRLRAGALGVVLTLPLEERWEALMGRVLDRAGRPVVGARVFPLVLLQELYFNRSDVFRDVELLPQTALTDTDGFFVLPDLSKGIELLRVAGAGMRSSVHRLLDTERRGRLSDVDIHVELRIHVRIQLLDPSEADGFAFRDAAGELVPMHVYFGTNNAHMRERQVLQQGASAVVSVTERAVSLELLKEGQRLRLVPIHLLPGRVNLVGY